MGTRGTLPDVFADGVLDHVGGETPLFVTHDLKAVLHVVNWTGAVWIGPLSSPLHFCCLELSGRWYHSINESKELLFPTRTLVVKRDKGKTKTLMKHVVPRMSNPGAPWSPYNT